MRSIFFSDFFAVSADSLEEYGAFNISLINDLPLFVDPFLLFNSKDARYQQLHADILRYMRFLKERTGAGGVRVDLIKGWFSFPEVKQNWLGFSGAGNAGHGLGMSFADALHTNFGSAFRDFGEETVTASSHLEKLCLIKDGVGRDNISDFTTNLIKGFLAEYTQIFAQKYIDPALRRRVLVPKIVFNYETRTWSAAVFDLPFINGDYVLLTPKNILTRDEAWINRPEFLERVEDIALALPDGVLRAHVNEYFSRVMPTDPRATKDERQAGLIKVIQKFPILLDYYIKEKEDHGDEAVAISNERVEGVQNQFVANVQILVSKFLEPGGFYSLPGTTYDEARKRVLFLKDVIENKGGQSIFYHKGKPLHREKDLHLLYRLTWFAPRQDVTREANDGRGPADFKVSDGALDKTLVEFKLASNSQLERNLEKQSAIYEKASDATHPTLKVIVYFDEAQLRLVTRILRKLNLIGNSHIILIDARMDNKPSGSRA